MGRSPNEVPVTRIASNSTARPVHCIGVSRAKSQCQRWSHAKSMWSVKRSYRQRAALALGAEVCYGCGRTNDQTFSSVTPECQLMFCSINHGSTGPPLLTVSYDGSTRMFEAGRRASARRALNLPGARLTLTEI